ncbi:MAG: hypothetical protein GX493_03605 [Firmicutes bacterium]|nr:hypothetical protein [Bacillota bacterium]
MAAMMTPLITTNKSNAGKPSLIRAWIVTLSPRQIGDDRKKDSLPDLLFKNVYNTQWDKEAKDRCLNHFFPASEPK